jgi:alkylation response protein AidB-like acyl-CoA dehydrogenase
MAGDPQTHFYMKDVHIPEENVLTHGDKGFYDQLEALNWERCGTAIGATTISMCAFEKALKYAQNRKQFDQSISEFQGLQWKLADMAKEIEASRTLTYRAVKNAQVNNQPPDRLETSIAKLYAAETVEKVVSEALQIHGANGYQQGHPIEYLYRYARGRRIGGGTDEIQKNGIASELLEGGLPTIN